MQAIPGHERDMTVREVIFRTTRTFVKITRPRANLTDPAGICLGWNRKADVLEAVENITATMFDAILVSGNHGRADFAVVHSLAFVVHISGITIQPFDHFLRFRAIVTQPNRAADDHDISRFYFFK